MQKPPEDKFFLTLTPPKLEDALGMVWPEDVTTKIIWLELCKSHSHRSTLSSTQSHSFYILDQVHQVTKWYLYYNKLYKKNLDFMIIPVCFKKCFDK